MIGGLGIWELVLILVIVLLIFGPSKLGDIGSALGKGVSGFKKSIQDKDTEETEETEEADKNNSSKKS